MTTIYDRLLLAKVETTKGTDIVPTYGSNAIRVKSQKISVTQDSLARETVKQTMGPPAHLVGKRLEAEAPVGIGQGAGDGIARPVAPPPPLHRR